MVAFSTYAVGCGDDEVFRAGDAGGFDAGMRLETGPIAEPDGGDGAAPSACGNSAGAPARLLLSMTHSTTSELAAFNIADKKVDGRYSYKGFIGLTSSQGSDPYLLEEQTDIVARLDAQRPWEVVSTWNVGGNDAKDGGATFAEPVAVVVADCTKGYVLRFNRNKIAVIDTTKKADGGVPDSFIDLAPLVQAGDRDGLVEMTGALYVPSKKRIYVLLGNVDSNYTTNFELLCGTTKPSIVAIDTTTGQLVSLGGTAPGGGIALGGYNPPLGASLVYDAARDRLLVVSGGCNADAGGGVAAAIQQRRIEEVDLSTGAVKTLLSLDAYDFPIGLALIDGNRAAVAFAGPFFGDLGSAYLWDPSKTTLGARIPGGLDYAANDGKGNFVGMRASRLGDGGAGPVQIVSVPYTDGGVDASSVTKLGENPFTDNTGLLSGAEVWPHP